MDHLAACTEYRHCLERECGAQRFGLSNDWIDILSDPLVERNSGTMNRNSFAGGALAFLALVILF